MKVFDITEREGKGNKGKEYCRYVLTSTTRETIGYDKWLSAYKHEQPLDLAKVNPFKKSTNLPESIILSKHSNAISFFHR